MRLCGRHERMVVVTNTYSHLFRWSEAGLTTALQSPIDLSLNDRLVLPTLLATALLYPHCTCQLMDLPLELCNPRVLLHQGIATRRGLQQPRPPQGRLVNGSGSWQHDRRLLRALCAR